SMERCIFHHGSLGWIAGHGSLVAFVDIVCRERVRPPDERPKVSHGLSITSDSRAALVPPGGTIDREIWFARGFGAFLTRRSTGAGHNEGERKHHFGG